MTAAQVLADVAAAYLLNARSRQELRLAVETERKSAVRLRELEGARSEFATSVIHELRTPMTSISGYAEILADMGQLTPPQTRVVEVIARNCRRLEALADELLLLSSVEPGVDSSRHAGARPRSPRRHGACRRAGRPRRRDLSVTHSVPATPVMVRGDTPQLERMVSNLMTNAVKFTPDGGHVHLAVELTEGLARVAVATTG